MKKILRRIAIGAGVLLGAIVLAAAGVYGASERHFSRRYTMAAETIPIPTDSASIERGRHLFRAVAKCAACHTESLGGGPVVDDPAMGRIIAVNLTRGKGGVAPQLTDDDWVRAIRHGVGHDGRPLLIMPSLEFQHLSAADVGAIVAYAKSVSPVDLEQPASRLGPVARALVAAGKMPLFSAEQVDHASLAPAVSPAPGPTAEYGGYIVRVGGCEGCHGPTFAGGRIAVGPPSWPPAANLTPTGLVAYDEASFITALRTGVRPGGTKIKPPMPVEWTRYMTDDEIRAVWLYLRTVPPREFGAR